MNTVSRIVRYGSSLMLAAALAFPTGAAAQTPAEMAGRWEGTLDLGPQGSLRLVFEITWENDTLGATMYSPDQSDQPVETSGTTLEDGTLTIAVARVQGRFVGSMNEEGAVVGTWNQGPASIPLTLVRAEGGDLETPRAAPLRMKCPGSLGPFASMGH